MDVKYQQILSLFEMHAVVPSSLIQKTLDVSERTVRTYIARLNEQLSEMAEISMERGRGYVLSIADCSAYDQLLRTWMASASPIPQTREERVVFLANDLLNRSDWVTLDALSRSLFVSRFTISDDLKEVERMLEGNGLSLERRSHRGIRVYGSEFDRRVCLANLALGASSSSMRGTGSTTLEQELRKAVGRVAQHVDHITGTHGLKINPAAYQNLLVHIAVAVLRLNSNHRVPMDKGQLEHIAQSDVYPVARELAKAVGEEFNLAFPAEEVAYIAVHLSGKQDLGDVGLAEGDEAPAAVPPESWDAATRMIMRVWECFGFDLRSDFELRMNLATHIAPLSVRLKYGMQMKNPLLTDIKARFPLAYSMAAEASTILSEQFARQPSDDEVGYLALSFALALDRQKTGERIKKRVLLVCASGAGSARLLEYRFKALFGDRLSCVMTCDAQSALSYDFGKVDCVFSTVPLPAGLPVPVFSVGAFLDDADIPEVRAALDAEYADNCADDISRFFDKALFFPYLQGEDKQGAISFLCSRMKECRKADANIEDLVWQREQAAVTSFGNLVAMPHPVTPVVDRSVVGVAILDAPIDWGEGKDVQVIFLVCVSRNKDKSLQPLYRSLARVMGDLESIKELISRRSYEALLEQLQRKNS